MKHKFISETNRMALYQVAKAVLAIDNFHHVVNRGIIPMDVELETRLKNDVWNSAVEVTRQHRLICLTEHEFAVVKKCVPDYILLTRPTPSKIENNEEVLVASDLT